MIVQFDFLHKYHTLKHFYPFTVSRKLPTVNLVLIKIFNIFVGYRTGLDMTLSESPVFRKGIAFSVLNVQDQTHLI